MSPVANLGVAVTPGSGTATSSAQKHANGAAGKGTAGGAAYGGNSGSGKAPFRHIDDIVSVCVDLDPYTTLPKVLEAGSAHMRQAITFNNFGRPDLALQEYIKAFTIAVDKVPKHKDYPSLKSDRGDLNRMYQALKVQITSSGATYDRIKEVIKEDNLRSGVRPKMFVSTSPEHILPDLPSVPSSPPFKQSIDNRGILQFGRLDHNPRNTSANGRSIDADPQSNNGSSPEYKTKPIIHPKPQALHGNSIKPVSDKAPPDLAARFAKLRDPQDSRKSSSPSPLPKPTGPRAMPLPYQPPLSVNSSLPVMPKIPDAIYSPARGTVTSEAANLPSSMPRGMFSRTNSVVSVPSTSSRTSMEGVIRPFNGERFVAAHTYGEAPRSPTSKARIPRGEVITVKELVHCMESGSADIKILLIDVRDRQSFDEGHIMSQSTICLDPTILSRQNISADDIVDSMILAPASEKLALERRDEADLVVFYDQHSEFVPQRINGNMQETVLFNLRQALVHYSYSKSLMHTPKLLVGGLDAWVDEMGKGSLQTSKTQSILSHATSTSVNTRQRLRNRTLKPDEVNTFEAMIGRDEEGDFDYARSREDFMRRFPSLKEPESMVSNDGDGSSVQGTDSGGEEFLRDITPMPPVRPKPSVARTRYSGLESADEHPVPGGLAMKAKVNAQKNSRPTGLVNIQNWCYANASIQALLHSPGFGDEILDSQWPVKYRPQISPGHPAYNQLLCRILGNLLQWLNKKQFRSMQATTLMHYLRSIHQGYQIPPNGRNIKFGDTNQHDSDEFITFIFNQLEVETHIELMKKPLPKLDITKPVDYIVNSWGNRNVYNIIHRHWYVVELQTFTCRHCKAQNFVAAEAERYAFPVLQRPNSSGNKSKLVDLIKDHFQSEEVETDCDSCGLRGKTKKTQIVRLPPLLRVGILRSDQSSSKKIVDGLIFPFDNLDLGPYALEASRRKEIAEKLGGEASQGFDAPAQYNLYAVVVHNGTTLNSGHYVCFVRTEKNKWTKFDDETITEDVKNPAALANEFHNCDYSYTPVQLYYQRVDKT
ncbi:cysteine proteinase [Xylariaceae sp. AK1471]|nr:cysteine proteinase [Xylariaceae sp. AK1471]